ncbi:hypothetical protein HAX54_048175 [Datura stramonium]|uniref:RING-type E3 ubiquitin transferase n=1 Tax=Datura stramonium TaxID=4076 RepID=A0ABS8STZ5_DATST|nr:hypothetical protein [Datura stramonium]
MSLFSLLHLLLIVVTSFAVFGEAGNDCRESRCNIDNGPSIHFPFRLQHQPEHCGYPGFELFCNKNMTMLTFSNSLTLVVYHIDYASQQINVILWKNCLVNMLYFNFSASPFLLWNVEPFPLCNYSIFNCSNDYIDEFGCSATPNSELIAVSNSDTYDHLQGCKKIDEIPSLSCSLNNGNVLSIRWLNPKCGYCEDHGMDCGFNNYTKQLGIHCFNRPVITTKGGSKGPLIAGGVLGEELKIRIEEDDDIIIARKLAIIGLWCIQWNATDRPSIKVVIQMLEGDGSNLTVPPPSTARNTTHAGTGAIANPSSTQELTVISELE